MPTKRTSIVFASPAGRPALRARKRSKTSSALRPRQLDSEGDDQEAGYRTDSDYEEEVDDERNLSRAGSSNASTRRRSAPGGSRLPSARRSSLPATQTGRGAQAGSSRPRNGDARTKRGGKEDDNLSPAVTQHRRPAAPKGHPLNPVPVNLAASRSRLSSKGKGKGKEREVEVDEPKRLVHRPMTRRASQGLEQPLFVEGARKRRSVSRGARGGTQDPEDDEMQEDETEEGEGEAEMEVLDEAEELEDSAEDEEDEDRTPRRAPRGRRATSVQESDTGETADGEDGEGEWEDEMSPEQEDAVEVVESKLNEWSLAHLKQLKLAELTELYLVISRQPVPSTKEALAQAIVSARTAGPSPLSDLTAISESETDGSTSPHPFTSREGSPERPSQGSRRRSGGSGPASRPAKVVRKKVVRRAGVRDQVPTPPHTSDEGDEDGEDDAGEATEVEEPRADDEDDELAFASSSTRMTRRASQVEMPPPPLPARRDHARTRSSAANVLSDPAESSAAAAARPVKKVGSPKHTVRVQFDSLIEQDAPMLFTSPIAHRTRGSQPHSSDRTSAPPSASTSASNTFASLLPPRAAKRKAVAKIAKIDKGKGRADDANSGSDEEMGSGSDEEDEEEKKSDPETLVLSDSDEELDPDSSIEIMPARRRRVLGTRPVLSSVIDAAAGRRRSSRTVKQVDTPPSDADEESGGETERDEPERRSPDVLEIDENDDSDVEISTEEMVSSLARREEKKAAKVVPLNRKGKGKAVEDADFDMVIDDDEEADEDEKVDEYKEDGDVDDDTVDLAHATSKTLLRCRKDELLRLCAEHDLSQDGASSTKKDLVDALLQWRDHDYMSSPASGDESSSSSTASNVSTQTAREGTKTQASAANERTSRNTAKPKPLLMRKSHPDAPDKPHTAQHSKAHEHQEDVNALDLASLRLQDKEIPPEALTRLERVGSGGFKDVYKGKYHGNTIAICDIRGHLTDMDIKELGLLRDLEHRNIVQFIGVSIPKQPSTVPVMIITELCENGDLFDYIRKIEPPPFLKMLEIMLGISTGLEYLHTHKPAIIHRDIKSSNVLITGKGVAKIADFGLARIKTSTQSMIRSLVGTVNWQAPELWSPHPRYNEKVDVYSVGLVFWEILQWHQPVKRYPFEGQNEHAIYHDVGGKQMRPPTGPLRRQWGGEIVDLISTMWAQCHTDRPSMTQVVAELNILIGVEKAKSKRR